ncbi:MAG: hypothetical protein JKY37_23925 [Nannocystaceae bacterium]|nr:hypothetical protein [Nannocystaceae bacterium]
MRELQDLPWEDRALAAEKTVTVLKDKVCALYNGSQSIIQKQLDKALVRDEKNRRRRAVVEAKADELQRHSARLEAVVAARTHQLRSILDNVTFGFLVLDRDLIIADGYTRSCRELLAAQEIGGRNLGEVFGLSERAYGNYAAGLDQLFEDLLPEDVLADQVVTRFELEGRVLRVEPRLIRGESGQPEAVLMSISDTTALEAAEREARSNAVLVSVLKAKGAFASFVDDVRSSLEVARDHVDDAAYVRRVIHTIKGNSTAYGLDEIARFVHGVEELDTIDVAAIDSIEAQFKAFLRTHRRVLEMDYDGTAATVFEVSHARMDELRTIAAEPEYNSVREWRASVCLKPAALVLGPIDNFVEKLAERLGKAVDFRCEGLEVLVDQDTATPVLRTVTHVIRNAVDHGLEDAGLRGCKPQRGSVSLVIAEDDTNWTVTVADDGRGINVGALVSTAIETGKLTAEEAEAMDNDARVRLLFLDGVSCRTEVTDISGRGVGTSAVLTEVRRVGGRVDVETKLGEGTTFRLVIPKPEALASAVGPLAVRCVPFDMRSATG